MNARQQEPPSSHLHGAGHNTSISRQRRTTKKQGGVAETAEETEAAAGGARGRQGHTGGAEWTDTTGSRGRAERNMRHNETFKCAMMVAWTSGRVRAKQRDRTT